jgi:hypothetical protein
LSGNNAGQGGLGGAGGTNGLPLAGTNTVGPGGIGGPGGNAGGIYDGAIASAAVLLNTLLAGNNAGGSGSGGSGSPNGASGDTGSDPDLAGEFLSLGHNLIGDVQGGFIDLTGSDLFGFDATPINPLLGPPANNDGATPTLALLPGSPAIDAGDDSLTATDQRGLPRKSGAHVDIGAFEVQQVNAANAPLLVRSKQLGAGTFQFSFADIPGASFSVLTSTNLDLPMSQWKNLTGVIEIAPGQYQFTDASATNGVTQYYRVRWP